MNNSKGFASEGLARWHVTALLKVEFTDLDGFIIYFVEYQSSSIV